MKLKELIETPLGVMAQAAVQRNPELEWATPEIAKSLKQWADENGYPIEYVICGLLNWLGTYCEDVSQPGEIS
jgi:hypothetical protein